MSSLLWAPPGLALAQETITPIQRTFTTDADFALGSFEGARAQAPDSDQLRIDTGASMSPFLWVANASAGTVTKVDTRNGRQVARYDSVLTQNWDGSLPAVRPPRDSCNYPTLTAVDTRGDALVLNRGNCSSTFAAITRYAGSRAGCVDRNGNGQIDTSSDANGDGVINMSDPAEFVGQGDECILWTRNYAAVGDPGHSLVVDADQHVWAAGYSSSKLYKLDGQTGAVLKVIDLAAEGGASFNIQGLAVGPGGYLYTSDGSGQRRTLKIDPSGEAGGIVVDSVVSPVPTFGVAVDRQGTVWLGADSDSATGVVRMDFPSHTAQVVGGGCVGRTHGVAVDGAGDIWAACTGGGRVLRLYPSGALKGSWSVGTRPEGVAVAADGMIWSTVFGNDKLAIINPGTSDYPQTVPAGGTPLTYSDMTGFQHHYFVLRRGSWSVVYDSGQLQAHWGTVSWNNEPEGVTPPGSSITVAVRAADTREALASQPFAPVVNSQPFVGVDGRFVEVKVSLRAANFSGDPVLSDLTISSYNNPPVALCGERSVCAGPTCTAQVSVDEGSYDPDGDPITLAQSPAGPYGLGTGTVGLTVSDPHQSASCSASVRVSDCEPPSITCGAPVQAECTGSESATVSAGGAEATDACSTVSVSGPGLAAYPLGTTPVTYTATDAEGNTASCASSVEVVDTLAPSITCPEPATAECVDGGASNTGVGPATASDVCSAVAVQSPGPATFPPGTVMLSWAATDSSGNTSSCSTQFTVADTQAPVLSLNGEAAQTQECGASYSDPGATASDVCVGDLSTQVVATGAIDTGLPGSYTRSYGVADPSGNSAAAVTRTVTVADTLAPSLALNGEASQSLECGSSYVDPGAQASDQCAGELTGAVVATGSVNGSEPGSYTVTYSVTDPSGHSAAAVTRTVTVADTQGPALVLNGASETMLECAESFIDPGATAEDLCAGPVPVAVSGAVDVGVPGAYTLSYQAQDPAGNASPTVTRTVTVADTQGPGLALNGPATLAHECAAPFADPGATATDACSGDVSHRVTVSGAVSAGQPGSYTLTYGATDPSGNAAAPVSRTVQVSDTQGPVLSLNGANPLPLECKRDVYTEPGATAVDACTGDVSGSITIEQPVIDPAVPGTYLVTYRAADSAGNAGTAAREVRVQDTLAPEISLNGATSLTLECKVDSFVDEGAVATDLCSGDVTASLVVTGAVDTNVPGAYPLHYRAQDGHGLVAEKVREVRVVDTQPPTLTLESSSTPVVECSRDAFVDLGAVATDLCAGDITHLITISGTESIVAPGTYPITYNVADPSGNAAAPVTIDVTVQDTQAPVVTLNGEANMTLECGVDTYTEPGATAYDACQGDMTSAINIYGNGANGDAEGTYDIQYGVWDSSGNTTMALRTVKVVDRLPPTLTLVGPATVQHECASGSYVDQGATAADACYGDLTGSVTTTGSVNAWAKGTYTLTYNVEDSALLDATPLTRTVEVADTQGPTLEYLQVSVSPADQGMRSFTLADCVAANDVCDGWASANNGTILSIYSDEPEDAADDSDGSTLQDIVITGTSTFDVRAELRSGGNGRVYGVSFELKDQSGNVRAGLCRIQVPPVEGGTATDDGSGAGYTVSAPQTLASSTTL